MEAASGIPPSCVFHISEHLSPFPRLSEERALPAGLSMQVSGRFGRHGGDVFL